jgi:dTDP-4-amino-4,6-dideoxygalactose transaminase
VPIFADIDESYCLDPADVEAKITPRTRAILVVHLLGNMGDIRALRDVADRHNLFLIEDCCQSHFAEDNGVIAGTIGDIAGVSFGGKHLNLGGGGMVLTSNQSLWERAILFRDAALPRANGPAEGRPYANYFMAPNYKMNDLMATMGRVQLKKVDGYVDNKIRDAKNIIGGLSDVDEIVPQEVRPGVKHTYWSLGFTLDTEALGCTADEFAEAVSAEGVPVSGPYLGTPEHGPLYRNPFLAEPDMYGHSRFPFDYKRERPIDYRLVSCPNGEELISRHVGMGMQPSFTEEYVGDIIEAYRKVAVGFKERQATMSG